MELDWSLDAIERPGVAMGVSRDGGGSANAPSIAVASSAPALTHAIHARCERRRILLSFMRTTF